MIRKGSVTTREIAALRARIVKVRHLSTSWERESLDSVDLQDVAKVKEAMSESYITVGRQAFVIAERAFWKGQFPVAGPDLSCRFNDLDFEPVNAVMLTPIAANNSQRPPRASRADYAPALRDFERAYALTQTPEANFYLGMIALRQGNLANARARFDQVCGTRTKIEHKLSISAAVFASITALLQGKLAEAAVALKRAKKTDPQDITFMKNQGYWCELQGELKQAVSWYRQAIEWEPQDGYALRRCLALEGTPVIELARPRDFHEKFAEIAAALRKAHGSKRAPKPLPPRQLDQIRLATRRDRGKGKSKSKSVELPESVKTILRHDRSFALWDDGRPLFRALIGAKSVVVSTNIDRLVRTDRWSPYAKAFKKLPARVPVWNEDRSLPACIPLRSSPGGEQLIFLYIGEPDDSGEYPIARYQEGELWVEESSLIHLIINEAMIKGIRFELGFDLDKLSAKASKRHAKHDERLSNHSLVQAIEEQT
jgi:tetratricopeptide (TPR) repeat protein